MYGLLSLCLLIAAAPLADTALTHSNARRTKRRLSPAQSSVVYASKKEVKHRGSTKGIPPGTPIKHHVELLRYVTAYRTGIEALVDMTPYTPLLQAAVAADNLTLYNFIDTYVGNHTESDVLYLNNVTNQCFLDKTSQGNGWSVFASLVFWPTNKDYVPQNTLPRESVTLGSGYYGGNYPIGKVGLHTANVSEQGTAVLLDKPVDFSSVKVAAVYDLEQHDAGMAALMGHIARQTEMFTRAGNTEAMEMLMEDAFETLLWQGLAQVHVTDSFNETRTVYGTYNGSQLHWERMMPVYMTDTFSDYEVGNGWWLNMSLPMKPVGHIAYVDGENVTISLKYDCIPGSVNSSLHGLPHLLIPESPKVLPRIHAMLESAKAIGVKAATSEGHISAASHDGAPMLLVDEGPDDGTTPEEEYLKMLRIGNITDAGPDRNATAALVAPNMIGQIDLLGALGGDSVENTWQRLMLKSPILASRNFTDGDKVLVLTQERHGHLLTKKFELPNLLFGDRVILQLAVTGHGWASTTEQCGEYCHAVYRLHLNDKIAANVTQFRDDCKDNPINGSVQYGTWDESRNGWCPGTVVPGLFIDVTDHIKKGNNTLAIDLLVWSNATLKYEPYTDYAGFVFRDQAELDVGLTNFIYDEKAVQAIRKQTHSFTPAEAAIRDGCSAPERLRPPSFVLEPSEGQVLLQVGSKATIKRPTSPSVRPRVDMRRVVGDPATFMGKHFQRSMLPLDRLPASELQDKPRRMARAEVRPEGHGYTAVSVQPHNHHAVSHSNGHRHGHRFDFLRRAPWYLFNQTLEGKRLATYVPIWDGNLQQGDKRDIQVHIDKTSIPDEWSQVALHFQLSKPPGDLEYDHWDRIGSLGLRFFDSAPEQQ